jgi:predicted RNA binding protein YcfA (HicA-like mRNA interferase family)
MDEKVVVVCVYGCTPAGDLVPNYHVTETVDKAERIDAIQTRVTILENLGYTVTQRKAHEVDLKHPDGSERTVCWFKAKPSRGSGTSYTQHYQGN